MQKCMIRWKENLSTAAIPATRMVPSFVSTFPSDTLIWCWRDQAVLRVTGVKVLPFIHHFIAPSCGTFLARVAEQAFDVAA